MSPSRMSFIAGPFLVKRNDSKVIVSYRFNLFLSVKALFHFYRVFIHKLTRLKIFLYTYYDEETYFYHFIVIHKEELKKENN